LDILKELRARGVQFDIRVNDSANGTSVML